MIVAVNDENKANLFACRLAAKFVSPTSAIFAERRQDTPIVLDGLIQLSSPDEISGMVSPLLRRKALGPDGITNEILKKLQWVASNRLSRIATSAMSLGSFPTRWKTVTVVMLPRTPQATTAQQLSPH
ncbi:hypothetical protein Zmor_022081 [Zophobas morio]|jgi:hypothetical protein|uniref:Uncharacterized protein n=1 Tax=Zophobas morio TaxID=2755281 RepID=A0AA38M0M8_9CUCU|nr:hypothetical protein Zmor_022081 [Zophobas morio]